MSATLRKDEELAAIALISISDNSLMHRDDLYKIRVRYKDNPRKTFELLSCEIKKVGARLVKCIEKRIAKSKQKLSHNYKREKLRAEQIRELERKSRYLDERYKALRTAINTTKKMLA
jgi:hypothetical protein